MFDIACVILFPCIYSVRVGIMGFMYWARAFRLRAVAKRTGTHFVISAVLTDTGAPAYFTSTGSWAASLQEAGTFATQEECDSQLAVAQTQERLVCDAYTIGVVVDGKVIEPLTMREQIRALGPTTRVRRPDTQAS